ncbi:succinylglutamate desuccinylase/aspartoacylase family protein [Natrinema salaciae]|nr:M99 family carboxypeptidase catalytic domain-containing protein [Natrinema salaciae]
MKGLGTAGATVVTGLGTLTAAGGSAAAASPSRWSYKIQEGLPEETTVHVIDGQSVGPTVMVVGGMHGDEPAGYDSAARIAQWSIESGRLVVLPEACKPAIRNGTRGFDRSGKGNVQDLNREFPAGQAPWSPLARGIWNVVTEENIDFLLDLHSSSGLYKWDEGDGVGQGIFATNAGEADQYRRDLQSYLNETFISNPEYNFTGATAGEDGTERMLKHKVGADLDTPAIIFETYRRLDDERQRTLTTSAVYEVCREKGMFDAS